MKKNFAEPEMEVVRFNAQEIVTATSGCAGIETTGIDHNPGGQNDFA